MNALIKILPGPPFSKQGAGLPPFIKGDEGGFFLYEMAPVIRSAAISAFTMLLRLLRRCSSSQ
jgi:hypothetical protein